jgi:hypothetical protein
MNLPLGDALGSKKFLAALAASAIAFFGFRSGMDEKTIALIIAPLLAYIPSQALADIGKERAKVEAAQPPKAPGA